MAKRVNYFLPYIRQGLTTLSRHADVPGQRMKVPVKLTVAAIQTKDQTTITEVVEKELTLFGPGDVLGIDEKTITRLGPAPRSDRFESSLIPFVEFLDPDFLWRYSSLQSPDKKSWYPWLALIVLKPDQGEVPGEFEKIQHTDPELPPRIRLKSNAILPDLRESWRWGHVYMEDIQGLSPAQLKNRLKKEPTKAVCRLMSPRKLKPQTKYHAFLIPAFRIGVDTGIGMVEGEVNRTTLTWNTPGEGKGQTIPYYFDWEFSAGTGGDFENLVRKLKPRDLENLGIRPMDCSNPGYGMGEEAGLDLQMEAALRSLDTEFQPWGMDGSEEDPEHARSEKNRTALSNLLNKRTEITQNDAGKKEVKLRVSPPVYGSWYLRDEGGHVKMNMQHKIHWLEELNLDFRHRAAAGLGVRFVKENQEDLMKAAWEQLNTIREVNRELNLGRFGREVSSKLYNRLGKMKPNMAFKMAMPMQNKIVFDSKKTIGAFLQGSQISSTLTAVKARKYLSKVTGDEVTMDFKPVQTSRLVRLTHRVKGLKGVAVNTKKDKKTTTVKAIKLETWPQKMVSQTISALDPKLTIESGIKNRLQRFRSIEKNGITQPAKEDPLHPVQWHPEFHRPMYRFLREMSQDHILPGLENIPQNSVGLLQTNRRFIEAFMVGLNHEMASELRWREFPTDLRGSYFRSFWDTSIYSVDKNEKLAFRSTIFAARLRNQIHQEYGEEFNSLPKIEATYTKANPNEIEKEIAQAYEKAIEKWLMTRDDNKDIQKLARWERDTRLGSHPATGPLSGDEANHNQLVLLVRGELLQKFNNTLIYLVQKNEEGLPDFKTTMTRIHPVFEGAMPPDVVFVGFPILSEDAPEYFVVFEERMSELRFGLDETPDGATPGNGMNDFSWKHFSEMDPEGYIDGIRPSIFTQEWDNAAFIGKVMMQKQVRAAIELERLILG